MGKLLALIVKDLYLHRRSLVISWLLVCAATLFFGKTYLSGNDLLKMTSLTIYNLMATIAYSEWLIYREKAKGTFAWLRSLPFSDAQIVSAKFLTHFLMLSGSYFLCVLLFIRNFLLPPNLPIFCLFFFACQAFGSLMVASRWLFGLKLGQTAPFVLLLILYIGAYGAVKGDPELARKTLIRIHDPSVALAVCVAMASIGLLAGYGTLRWFSTRDTQQLIE